VRPVRSRKLSRAFNADPGIVVARLPGFGRHRRRRVGRHPGSDTRQPRTTSTAACRHACGAGNIPCFTIRESGVGIESGLASPETLCMWQLGVNDAGAQWHGRVDMSDMWRNGPGRRLRCPGFASGPDLAQGHPAPHAALAHALAPAGGVPTKGPFEQLAHGRPSNEVGAGCATVWAGSASAWAVLLSACWPHDGRWRTPRQHQ
jgi:hypothetical protein